MEQETESIQQSLKLCAEASAYMEKEDPRLVCRLPSHHPQRYSTRSSSLAEPSLDKLMVAEAFISAQKAFTSAQVAAAAKSSFNQRAASYHPVSLASARG
jgi:hypothetical protein